jgi:hypothetical protein
MIAKTVKYTDYNGNEREDKLMFNLDEAELMEMELSTTGGLSTAIEKIVQADDTAKIIAMFKDIVLRAYGEISDDGRRFVKNDKLREEFQQSKAYSTLFMELATDADAAIKFVEGAIDIKQDDPRLALVKKQNNAIPAPPEK